MRIALTTALMMAATLVWADEPTPAEEKPAAAAEQVTPASADAPDPASEAQPAATEQTAAETAAAEQPATEAAKDDKPFKVPAGYRGKRINGKQMYCTSSGAVTGARLSGKEQCRTEEQLRAIEKRKAEMEQR